MTIDRITSRVQEILASTVVGRQRQLSGLMGRVAGAVAGPDPAEDVLASHIRRDGRPDAHRPPLHRRGAHRRGLLH